MASQPIPAEAAVAQPVSGAAESGTENPEVRVRPARTSRPRRPTNAPSDQPAGGDKTRAPERQPAADYASTRLVNFRIPVDLHDRFRALVHESETRHPWLRKQSLTELLIAMLEEGPQTADEVAELIRRKRLAEHEGR
jgi:hypothetical protein